MPHDARCAFKGFIYIHCVPSRKDSSFGRLCAKTSYPGFTSGSHLETSILDPVHFWPVDKHVRLCQWQWQVVGCADVRLKFMTVLMLIVLAVSGTITVMRFGLNPLWANHFIPELSTHYQTSAMFAAFYGLLNFYMFTMAFVYSPSRNAVYGPLPVFNINFRLHCYWPTYTD